MKLMGLTDEAPILFVYIFTPDRDAASWQVKEHAERSFPGGRSGCPGEEPALGDDAHAANRRGAGNRQVEPPTGEEAHAEGDVAEPGAVRTEEIGTLPPIGKTTLTF
jgi:hypothetical protein